MEEQGARVRRKFSNLLRKQDNIFGRAYARKFSKREKVGNISVWIVDLFRIYLLENI